MNSKDNSENKYRSAVGIIGGTGLYTLEGLEDIEVQDFSTPYGHPSSSITSGNCGANKVYFIARHGKSHALIPSEVNFRANIYALKSLKVVWCISVGAVESLNPDFQIGDFVLPDQLIDFTRQRPTTFFGDGICVHIPFSDPYCNVLRDVLTEAALINTDTNEFNLHRTATYACLEGPAPATRAEAEMIRRLGSDIMGMTACPEAKLAREAEISYANIGIVTDTTFAGATNKRRSATDIGTLLHLRMNELKRVLLHASLRLNETRERPNWIANALDGAILTDLRIVQKPTLQRLMPILGKYVK
jgi:5'-methylthioadenosine phosphorylase